MKILVTGFDPFGGERINPSGEVVKMLPDTIEGREIVKIEIPTSFNRALPIVESKIIEVNPDYVISVGQAGGRKGISIERIAINIDDADIPDNDGFIPKDKPIVEDGQNAYFSTLPIKAMLEAVKAKSIPAEISNSAGTFVCNHVFYGVRHFCETQFGHIKSGFIHIPYLPEQAKRFENENQKIPFMELENAKEGLISAIETIRNYP